MPFLLGPTHIDLSCPPGRVIIIIRRLSLGSVDMDLSCLHTHTAPLIFILFLDKKREGKKPSITLSNVFIPMGTTTTPPEKMNSRLSPDNNAVYAFQFSFLNLLLTKKLKNIFGSPK
jgi:hypothetical protein